MGVFLATIDGSIVNVALPTLARELRAPFAAVQWVVLGYLLTLVTLMMVAGRLADLHGRKPLYAAGFVIFTFGSLLCGLSPHVVWLVAARVVQGVGASLLMALGAAVVTDVFPPQERGKAMGLIGLMVSVGLVSGPTLGGLILGLFSWHAIFFVNLPLGVVGTLVVLKAVPAQAQHSRQGFDLRGATLLLVALLAFLLAITLGPRASFLSPLIVTLLAAALLGFVAFVRVELSVKDPLVDLRLFRSAPFATNLVTGILVFVASAGLVFLLPFFLQSMQGRSPRETGLLLAMSPVMMGLTAPASGWLSDRVGTRPLTILGLGILVLAYVFVGTLEISTDTVGYIARAALIGLGMGIFQSPNNSAIMGAVPRERLGVASGLMSLSRTLGQTTGVALIGALWAAVVHVFDPSGVTDAMAAPVTAQLDALRWVARGIALLLCLALGLAVANWKRRRTE